MVRNEESVMSLFMETNGQAMVLHEKRSVTLDGLVHSWNMEKARWIFRDLTTATRRFFVGHWPLNIWNFRKGLFVCVFWFAMRWSDLTHWLARWIGLGQGLTVLVPWGVYHPGSVVHAPSEWRNGQVSARKFRWVRSPAWLWFYPLVCFIWALSIIIGIICSVSGAKNCVSSRWYIPRRMAHSFIQRIQSEFSKSKHACWCCRDVRLLSWIGDGI